MDHTLLKRDKVAITFSEENINRDLNYWIRQLDGDFPELSLPTDNPRLKKPIEYETYNYTMPNFIYEDIVSISKRENATPFMVMMAMYKVLLHRYSGEEDIVVGTNISGSIMDKEASDNLFFNTSIYTDPSKESYVFSKCSTRS